MAERQLVDIADRVSRKRAVIAIVAVVAFLGIQVLQPSAFLDSQRTGIDWWAVNAIALLAVLATGGGVLNPRGIRRLVHDELSRSHLRTAIVGGYWVAMGLGFVLYFAPWFRHLTSRQTIYLLVTGSVVVPLVTFAFLERRAHADG